MKKSIGLKPMYLKIHHKNDYTTPKNEIAPREAYGYYLVACFQCNPLQLPKYC